MTALVKPNYDENRQILAEAIPLRTPFAVQMTPSSICNFRCNYCIQASPAMEGKMLMEWDMFSLLCDQLAQFDDRLKQVTIAGWGEPLVNKDLPRMIAHMKKMDIAQRISVVTNGSLLKGEYALALVEAGVDVIKISLQGLTAGKYMEVADKKLDFARMVENIAFLYKHRGGCEVYIKIADIALAEGEEEVFYSTFRDITDRMYVESIRPIFDAGQSADGACMSKYGAAHPPIIVCPQPFYMMNVTAAGDVLPCCSYYDPTNFGNITQTPIKDMWHGAKMRAFLKMLLAGTRKTQDAYPACRECTIPDVVVLPGDELDTYADALRKKYDALG